MPYHEPDPSDPNMLVGVTVNCSAEELSEMAAAFSSELAALGHDVPGILELFRQPAYAGAHLAWRELGEAEVRSIVEQSVEFWSHVHVRVTDAAPPKRELLWPGRS